MFCLSKGLGAPVGSVLCGEREFIARARQTRKMLGGGMRQAGVIAAAGLYALRENLPLLKEDHHRAKELAQRLVGIPGISLVDPEPPTNMVYFELDTNLELEPDQLKQELKEKGILIGFEGDRLVRLVTHLWISDEDIRVVGSAFQELLS